jgi:catechol 2,3-dioxygenase-like lactoylglutathione lyase family enzyme
MKQWYRERLGIGGGCSADESVPPNEWVWNVTAGPVVFEPFRANSDYFPADKQHMINLRVDDLDAVLAPFRAARDEVITKPEWDEGGIGRFARVFDPEGNPIELWEPPKE